MIKVLHYSLSSNLGGIETYLMKLTEFVDNEKFHFDFVVSGQDKPAGYEMLTNYNCKFHYVTPRRKSIIKNYKDMKSILDTTNYDVVHCHLLSLSYSLPIFFSLKKKVPVIIHSHSSNSPQSLITKILHNFNKIKLRGKKYEALAVSRLAKDWMFLRSKKVEIINNGIDIERFKFNLDARNRVRKEFNLLDKTVFIHVGTLKEVKNHNFIIEVFDQYLKINPNSILILVGGDGDLRQELNKKIDEKGISDEIIFTGVRNDIPDLLSASDLLLFPSLYEGFPGVVVEAQTSGLPCLISDTITDEVVVSSNCKRISIGSEPSYWASLVNGLIRNTDRNNAYQIIEDHGLSVKSEMKKLECIYTCIAKTEEKIKNRKN